MDTLITIVHVFVCIFLVLVVLLQAGKGGGMGIAFGGAGSSTVFGGSGAGNFLTRLTVLAAFGFMITSMTLAYFSSHQGVDPLKQLSVRSREAAEEREQMKEEITEGVVPPAPAEGATGEGADAPPLSPDEARDLIEEQLVDMPEEGAEGEPEPEAEPQPEAEPEPEPEPAPEADTEAPPE